MCEVVETYVKIYGDMSLENDTGENIQGYMERLGDDMAVMSVTYWGCWRRCGDLGSTRPLRRQVCVLLCGRCLRKPRTMPFTCETIPNTNSNSNLPSGSKPSGCRLAADTSDTDIVAPQISFVIPRLRKCSDLESRQRRKTSRKTRRLRTRSHKIALQ